MQILWYVIIVLMDLSMYHNWRDVRFAQLQPHSQLMGNVKVAQLEQVMIQLIKYALNAQLALFLILLLLNAKIIKLSQILLVHKEPAMIQ